MQSLSKPKDDSGGAIATNVIGVIATFIFLQTYGAWVLNGVAEEKSSRIAEVLLAAVRPRDLVSREDHRHRHRSASSKRSTVAITAIVAARVVDLDVLAGHRGASTRSAPSAGSCLGFGFYGWAFAAAGSLVSRQSEAGAAAFPVYIPLFAGYFAATTSFGATDPNALIRVLAYVPPTAPLCMPVLIANDAVAGWQVALAALGVVGVDPVMARLAGAVYANSILRAGKRMKWLEAIRRRLRRRC